jgi:hypothetical protein
MIAEPPPCQWTPGTQTDRGNTAVNGQAAPEAPPSEEPLTGSPDRDPFHLTDMGTAQRLTHRYGQDRYSVDRWGKWLQWDGRPWDLENIRAIEDLRDRSGDKTSACF